MFDKFLKIKVTKYIFRTAITVITVFTGFGWKTTHFQYIMIAFFSFRDIPDEKD